MRKEEEEDREEGKEEGLGREEQRVVGRDLGLERLFVSLKHTHTHTF